MSKAPQVHAGAGMRGATSIDSAARNSQRAPAVVGRPVPVHPALVVLLVAALLLCACAAPPKPIQTPPPVAAAPPAEANQNAEAAVLALILAEGQGAAARNLAALATLWAEDAEITETRNTPDPSDDYHWRGRLAILDRYEVAVFPNPPAPPTSPPSAPASVAGDRATLINGIDAWSFVRRDGRWWIAALQIGEQQ